MTNSKTNTNTNDTDTNLDGWNDYLESINAMTVCVSHTDLASSFATARRNRLSYEKWVAKTLDAADLTTDNVDFLVSELERLNSSDDSGLNTWGTREELGDIEHGIINELPRWTDMGWTIPKTIMGMNGEIRNPDRQKNAPTEAAEDVTVISLDALKKAAELGPEMSWINEKKFITREDAQRFVDKTRAAFKKGDHTFEIINTEVKKDTKEPFIAVVLEADGNWEHRKALSTERDRHLDNAVKRIANSSDANELNKHARIIKRYSRDMQVLNNGHTKDGNLLRGRQVGIGFNYVRFARAMNAVADRASELNIDGFRSYTIKEFETTRKPVDGDMLDKGCAQGEFLALEVAEEITASLWDLKEGTYKASQAGRNTLRKFGSTGFVFRDWKDILADTDHGYCMAKCALSM